jgi:hypothetical protein
MDKFADFVAALSHYLEPATRDGTQFACVLPHPSVDGGIALDRAVESQQFRFHRRSLSAFGDTAELLRGFGFF